MNHATSPPLSLSATETSPHKGAAAAGAGGSILSATNLSSSGGGGGRGGAAAASSADSEAAADKGPLEKVDCGSLCKSLVKVRTSRPFFSMILSRAIMLSATCVKRGAAHAISHRELAI